MQVSNPNNVKIYNLSAGKSLPEWLSERRRRNLSKKNVDIRRRIELIQDFDMPGLSSSVKVSKDGQYVLATGAYKPRMKCFDVNNLSLKFERCFDSEVVTFEILSDDYSKLVFLHCDRHIEFHAAHGKYHRLRIPRFGRDTRYHYPSCDLFIVGVSNEIYRLNLERGQFLQSFVTEASAINKCSINPTHHLLMVGTQEGKVEAWDPRARCRVGVLDCAFHCVSQDNDALQTVPSITALQFQGGLTLGIGTATGQVLLYDIRSSKPLLIKDHMYGLPIKNVEFHRKMNLVYSMDSSIVKIWERETGKLYTSVEAQTDFNDLCVIPNTGMLFIANENTKMQTYYIPSLGPAPSWCSFLDNLTEELEELNFETIYDDYKFVTEKELDEMGLSHLKGSNLLRAYMHGYFMDVRLYRKARNVIQPFTLEEYKKRRIRQKVEEERTGRVEVHSLPKINKDLALKLIDSELNDNPKKKKKSAANLLKDERFKALFSNPDFQVDKNSEEYTLLNPVVSQLDKTKAKELSKKLKQQLVLESVKEEEAEARAEGSVSFTEGSSSDETSTDDEKPWAKEVRTKYRVLKRNVREAESVEFENSENHVEMKVMKRKQNKASLGERLHDEGTSRVGTFGSLGNKEMTFDARKMKRSGKPEDRVKRHRKEYGHNLRPAGNINDKSKAKFNRD